MNNELQLLFIVGMQKSGTSLLNRMLMQQSFISNPFLPEGAKFWGDLPPFSPREKPCGELFQFHQGRHGHYLDRNDFREKDRELLMQRIIESDVKTPILMNKNPYNSVRVSWLKSVFPTAKIFAVFRKPTPNIYSLLKKHQDHEGQGVKPESGWWGIKPKGWKSMKQSDKIIQSIMQWNAVNESLLNSKEDIDCYLDYESICSFPNEIIDYIKKITCIAAESKRLSVCKNFNNEYLVGSRLLSKNKELKNKENYNLHNLVEKKEFEPFNPKQYKLIDKKTETVWRRLISNKFNFHY